MWKYIKIALATIVVMPILASGVLWLGATTSLDKDRAYTAKASQLPQFTQTSGAGRVRIQANDLEFIARIAGFDRSGQSHGNVLLLHGFPESSLMWQPLIDTLAAAGYRVVAFDQRGYSPSARPLQLTEYTMPNLVGDVAAIAQAVGFNQFHLVGHDWGAAVGWATTLSMPDLVSSYNALSIPHVAAFSEAIATKGSDQRKRSAYMGFFATPWLPEQVFAFDNFDILRSSLYTDHSAHMVDEYISLLAEPGALTAALNWYRAGGLEPDATPGNEASNVTAQISLPVQFIWGNQDPAVSPDTVALHRPYLVGDYREVELDAGHWLMEEQTTLVVERVVNFIQQY